MHPVKEYFPLHVELPSRYLLLKWLDSGEMGFDEARGVNVFETESLRTRLREINKSYDWSKTTALSLVPAIEAANQGKNVVVMSYGNYKNEKYRGGQIITEISWFFRGSRTQKIALAAVIAAYAAFSIYYMFNVDPRAPGFPIA